MDAAALDLISRSAATAWAKPEDCAIDDLAYYLVKTNGGEWRDPDLRLMKGYEVRRKSEVSYIRGRPVLIARVNDPKLST